MYFRQSISIGLILIFQFVSTSTSLQTPLQNVDEASKSLSNSSKHGHHSKLLEEQEEVFDTPVISEATTDGITSATTGRTTIPTTPEAVKTSEPATTSRPTTTIPTTPEAVKTSEPAITSRPTTTIPTTPEAVKTSEPATTSRTTTITQSTAKTTTDPPPKDLAPRVTIKTFGTAKGTILQSFEGRPIYAFMSIPYALPSEGNRRFKYPQPYNKNWPVENEDGEYEANFLRARCIQASLIITGLTAGREDCLHLSIYTPRNPEDVTKPLPVMVWFHGGAYLTGDANLYVPTKLMDREIMVVVVQYRLGSLGFLAGNIADNPGNMGLMDQITALRWVQNYISFFGGDRDLVTVFGQSAGGASTSWMQITPLTNGSAPANEGRDLLHRVIPESGSALEVWTVDPEPEDGFLLTAKTLGCTDDTKKKMLKCMRGKTADEVNKASLIIYLKDRQTGGLGFKGLCPVVQTFTEEEEKVEVVIPKAPLEMLQDGEFMRVPTMAGTVRDEGSLVVGLAYKDYMYPLNYTTDNIDFVKYEAVSTILNAFGMTDQNGAVANSMRVAYFPYAELGNWASMVGGMIDMTGVLFLKSGLWEVANQINRVDSSVPIFFYSFEFTSHDSLYPWMFISMPDVPVPGGISHADELMYLFHLPSNQDERQRNMTKKMITLWSNFAKYGDPTPSQVENDLESWQGFTEKWKKYSNEDYDLLLLEDDFVNTKDFTTRWNYHRGTPKAQAASRGLEAEKISTAETDKLKSTPSVVSAEDYEALMAQANSQKVALGIFEGFAVVAVIAALVVLALQKKTFGGNAIV